LRISEQAGVGVNSGVGFEEIDEVGNGVSRKDVELDGLSIRDDDTDSDAIGGRLRVGGTG